MRKIALTFLLIRMCVIKAKHFSVGMIETLNDTRPSFVTIVSLGELYMA